MDGKHLKFLRSRQLIFFSILLIGGLMLFFLQPAEMQVFADAEAPETEPQQPANEACLGCHSMPGQVMTFPSGEILPVTVDAEGYEKSIHGSMGFNCVDCHTEITEYPHPELEIDYLREYVVTYKDTCSECHSGMSDRLQDSVHSQALELGNLNAPVCSDCHDPHSQSKEGMSALTQELGKTSQVCAQCHNSIYVEYAQSVHGSALINENNADAASCEDCHGVHSIEDPTTNEARLKSPDVCSDCHTNAAIMDKYGLSTNVLETYVADFHGTTVEIFERQSPDQPLNMPVCYDCHGVHNVRSVDDPETGIHMKENLLVTCQKCHPDAEENLTDSWLGHYEPAPDKHLLVFIIDRFYRWLMIPGVIGGMMLFVAVDFGRKIIDKRKVGKEEESEKVTETTEEVVQPPEASDETEEVSNE